MKNASKKRTTFYEESLCVRALFIIEWVNPHSVGQSSLSLSDIPFFDSRHVSVWQREFFRQV
jgi:hypothetical protein